VSDAYPVAGGQQQDFQRGVVSWNAATGATAVTVR